MPTLTKTIGTREFTLEALNTLSFRLLSSGLSYIKETDLVYQLLDQRGRLLISQIAPNFQVGQAIFEQYVPFYSPEHPFEIAYIGRSTGSVVGGLGDILQAVGASSLADNLTSLDSCYMLLHASPIPGPSRYFTLSEDNSNLTLQLTRKHNTFQDRNFFDLSHEEVPHNFKLIRNHVTQQFQAGISIVSGGTSFPAHSLDLSGLYAEDLGNQTIRIGTNLNRPVMTLLGANPLVLQVNVDSYSDPGCQAVDSNDQPLSVSVSPSTIDTSLIQNTLVTYVASWEGGTNSLTRVVSVLDQTQPLITLAPHPTLGTVNFTIDLNEAFMDPGVLSVNDNYDTIPVSAVSQTGSVDISTAGTYNLVHSVSDSAGNTGQVTRTITVAAPFPPPTHYIAGPIGSATTYNNMLPTSRTSVTVAFWMVGGNISTGHIVDLFGSHLGGDGNNVGWMVYSYASYTYSTPYHGGAGPWGSRPSTSPMLYILEVDVSENPSRLRFYFQNNYENPWQNPNGGSSTYTWEINRSNGDIAFWTLIGGGAGTYHNRAGGKTIKDVRVYHRLLTSAERVQLANLPPS